ncbi:hypothetical protein AB4305_14895 [Nocardia sp. 2YAB30]|uniref:hypothetical protein n=1 Tax=unclassified Nocardia TaxID=2637762 RepID=UPI003F9645B6
MTDFYSTPILGQGRVPGDLMRLRPALVPPLPGAAVTAHATVAPTLSRGHRDKGRCEV